MSGSDNWAATVIDVSKWQSSLPDLTGVAGVIARAGIGTKPDEMFTTHIAKARRAGLWVGSYWFNWGSLSVSDQVNAYIAREQEVGGVQLHVIDWEATEGFTATQTADFIRLYKARTGNLIGLYASEGRFRDLGQDWNWIANYSREPIKAYDMWQYGSFRGVDGNNARQRILDLARGTTVTPAPILDRNPKIVTANEGHTWRDLDGTTILDTGRSALAPRLSPYGIAGGLRAIYSSLAGHPIVIIDPATVTDVPVTIPPGYFTQAQLDAAIAAKVQPIQGELTTAKATITALNTSLSTVRTALTQAEAARTALIAKLGAAKTKALSLVTDLS